MNNIKNWKLYLESVENKYLFGHDSASNAYVVDDYPYGFRLRTSIRYWIETTTKGDRFCSQTLNPKTKRWNKPKKSTYQLIGVMYLNEKDHVTWTGVHNFSDPEEIQEFVEKIGGEDVLNSQQLIQLKQLRGEKVELTTPSGKIKKDFTIKFLKNYRKTELIECVIKFNRPDRVSKKEIIDAMKTANQEKLYTVWDNNGIVRITLDKGYQLTTVGREFYDTYKNVE